MRKKRKKKKKRKERQKKEAHLVDDAAGQSVRPPRGNAAARHPDERRANKLERREGEYARAGSPVHRTVFRRELRLRGREREGEKEREEGTKGRKERKDGGGGRERAHRWSASRRAASKQPLSENWRWWWWWWWRSDAKVGGGRLERRSRTRAARLVRVQRSEREGYAGEKADAGWKGGLPSALSLLPYAS